ncbi:MAG TPA: hypothetical protein VKU00_32280 [Chthonomonadaceae bacterium]|nr:hypothetical protein [Chthonomonadaceae bacterium]
MSQSTLFRYNFRVLMFHNWLLLAFPVAVSQLTVFWFILTTSLLTPDLPARSVEMVTPLLAAFLGAHLLSAEYRSRIGAVLASRPVNIGRIVVMRLLVMLALVWVLALISLGAFYAGLKPYDLAPDILACIPSTLFLTMLALTFATLYRHPLVGFGVAALYWAMDLVPGAPLQPYLSLRSLSSYYASMNNPYHLTFLESWWIAKGILLAAALLLYMYHSRLVFTLGTPLTLRTRRRASLAVAGILAFYLISGAVLKVGYGYQHRGTLPNNDLIWFRYQFASYGPLPVAPLFGPAFTRYLGEINNPWRLTAEEGDAMGDNVKHYQGLDEVVSRMPKSIWAASAAEARARLEGHRQKTTEETITYYQLIVDRYSQSPYLDYALRMIARTYADANRTADAQAGYENLLKRIPGTVYRSEALRFLTETELKAGHLPQAGQWAEQWAEVAPLYERFEAWVDLAQIRKAQGDVAGAKQAAQTVLTAVREFRKQVNMHTLDLTPTQENLRKAAANKAEQVAQSLL